MAKEEEGLEHVWPRGKDKDLSVRTRHIQYSACEDLSSAPHLYKLEGLCWMGGSQPGRWSWLDICVL